MKTLKIEMIHDVVCSWCHIGYHNISRALERVADEVSAEFHYLPFLLNPGLAPQGKDIVELLCQRNRWSVAEAMAYREQLLAKTREVGVTIDFGKRTRYYPTLNAHRLILAAEDIGRQREVHQALLQAYHVEGENIGDFSVLGNIAKRIGLADDVIVQAMTSDAISRKMQHLSERVGHHGVRSVPAFILNGSRFVSGSHSADFFEQLIRLECLVETPGKENFTCPV